MSWVGVRRGTRQKASRKKFGPQTAAKTSREFSAKTPWLESDRAGGNLMAFSFGAEIKFYRSVPRFSRQMFRCSSVSQITACLDFIINSTTLLARRWLSDKVFLHLLPSQLRLKGSFNLTNENIYPCTRNVISVPLSNCAVRSSAIRFQREIELKISLFSASLRQPAQTFSPSSQLSSS